MVQIQKFKMRTRLIIYCVKQPEDAKDHSVFITLEQDYYGGFYEQYYGKLLFYNKSANFVLHPDEDDRILKDSNNVIQYRFCNLNDILNPENKFIENDKFTIQIKGMLFFESSPKDREQPSLTLGHYLWERDDDRDFVISVGKKNELKTEVKIHKCVFASRSPVFDRMLESEMKEKAENKFEIIDFNAEIVKIAVKYFYDRKTYKTCNADQLIDLLQFAQKYDIQDLKSKVEHILIIKVRPNNICQISNASINANSTKLKEVCIQLMLFYMNRKLPFNEEITLDEDFVIELNQTAALPV